MPPGNPGKSDVTSMFSCPKMQVSKAADNDQRQLVVIYTVGHKKRAPIIFLITLANIDGFS